MRRTHTRRASRFDIVPIGLVAMFVIGVFTVTNRGSDLVRFSALALGGRIDDACSFSLLRTSAAYEGRRAQARNAIAEQSTLVIRDGDLVQYQTPYGLSWISGAQPLELARFRAPDLYHWPPRWAEDPERPLVRAGGIFIDGGGHIGESAATALRLGAARVITVEPDPINAEAIRRNLALAIADGRLTVVEVGLWDEPGTLKLERGEASSQSELHVIPEGASAIEVPTKTLDAIVRELDLPRVDAIKLDIEGAEPNALRGARQTLAQFKPKLAVGAYHKPGDREEIPAIVREARPDYTMRVARCLPVDTRIQAHELFFE